MNRSYSIITQNGSPEALLVENLKEGSESAFNRIFNLYYKAVYFQALKLLGDDEMAEDVAQETFSKLWIQREHIANLGMETLKPYLVRIARNLCLDEIRRRKYRQQYQESYVYEATPISQPDDTLEKMELLKQLYRILGGIRSRRRRQVVEQIYLEEKDRKQVMAEMGITKNTVKEQLRRGIQILRDQQIFLKAYR